MCKNNNILSSITRGLSVDSAYELVEHRNIYIYIYAIEGLKEKYI